MTDIKPQTLEGRLRVELRGRDVAPEKGEHTYHLVPPDPGETNMELRKAAIDSLLQADTAIAAGKGRHYWWKN